MALTLKPGHSWDIHQTYGRLLDTGTVPDKTWVALIVDDRTGAFVVDSGLHATRSEAVAAAVTKYRQ
ncbi:hypothetical protein GCM10010293_40500 [Streptomyces griseoflavus]|uniref:hypothetical protein n=1 Tax=Streptomyces griseoflavus TaxID=35619 RepID=UPI00167D497D|nr:hypothetical protein [Streptomyces griseoflavus]GGV36917.1 hypothetical protein GCM10010293_40500 [Streptomyces griseoflavus]